MLPRFLTDHSLRPFNTLRLPAVAQYYCEVHSLEDLRAAVGFAREQRLELTLLGGGSNVVLGNRVAGLVVRIAMAGIVAQSDGEGWVRVTVAAGEPWHPLVVHCLQQGWFGLENLALIPGLAGAAPIQNIGAYGVELERFLHSVRAVDLMSGECLEISAADCELGYRDSAFKGRWKDRFAVHAIQLKLPTVPAPVLDYPSLRQSLEMANIDNPDPMNVYDAVCRLRVERLPDPALLPNAGSFFKNPVVTPSRMRALVKAFPDAVVFPLADGRFKVAAAWLIDKTGWKGQWHGAVGVHDKQALVLCHSGEGDAEQLLQLARLIIASVEERFAIALEMEPRCYACAL